MAVKGWIGFVAVFAGVLLAMGAGFFYWKISGNRKCEVELVSESKVIKVEVVDKEKFYKFITDYIPCERGYFIASRADSMYKFNDREEWITGKQDDYKFRAEEIGLSYQAVL